MNVLYPSLFSQRPSPQSFRINSTGGNQTIMRPRQTTVLTLRFRGTSRDFDGHSSKLTIFVTRNMIWCHWCSCAPQGVPKSDVHIELFEKSGDRKRLVINWQRRAGDGEASDQPPFGSFSRTVLVPEYVRMEDLKAKLQDGVLTVTFANRSKEEAKSRTVPINSRL